MKEIRLDIVEKFSAIYEALNFIEKNPIKYSNLQKEDALYIHYEINKKIKEYLNN